MCEKNATLVHLWRGADKVKLDLEDGLDGALAKVVSVGDRVFFMTKAGSLYYGDVVDEVKDEDGGVSDVSSLSLRKSQLCAVDLAANSEHIFIVTHDGTVQKINPRDFSVIDNIILDEGVKYCSHGSKQESCMVKVTSIAVNDSSVLFVTENGQLWASGEQAQIDIKSDLREARRVSFFEGRIVSDVACGTNFHAVLVQRLSRLAKDDCSDSDNEAAEEVFVKSCSQCLQSNNLMPTSPMSVASSDTGLMNVNLQPFSEEHYSCSSTSKEDVFHTVDNEKSSLLNSENSIASGDLIIDEVAGSEKEVTESKKNSSLLINTETARQFFTRQLSWVSSYGSSPKEVELLQMDAIDNNPTSLIKQNVTSMASLVYEGVKTVGDKVVTLSRHVSGSSDPNEARAEDDASDNFEELGIEESKRTAGSLINSLKRADDSLVWSSSTGSSEHELVQKRLNKRVQKLVGMGSCILSSELWTWGDVKYGQLGVGDIISRPRPQEVTTLGHSALRKIACGDFHTLALTLDGRVFAWGRNNYMQVAHCSQVYQKSPQLFSSNYFLSLSPNERARDIAAGGNNSLIMTDQNVFLMGKHKSSGIMSSLEIPDANDMALKNILCTSILSCCTMTKSSITMVSDLPLIEEQVFLEETLHAYQNLIKPLQVKGGAAIESDVYEALCCSYQELLSVNVLNVKSLQDYYSGAIEAHEVTIVINVDEFINVFKLYLNAVCDIVSLGGFVQIPKLIDTFDILLNVFKDKVKGKNGEITNESIVAHILQRPIQHLNRYISIINNLIKLNKAKTKMDDLQDALSKWDLISKEQAKRLQDAESTKNFWEGSGKSIEQFRSPERRMIRESRSHAISLHNSSRFSSHWFILLTDVFIHVSGTNYYSAHLLPLLWVELLPDSDTLKNAISITTPEDSFILYTPTAADRSEWFHALQTAIKNSLQRSASHMPPQIRTGSFSFAKHAVYKDATYTGQWMNGKLHGSGKLEWADNRMYIGQFHKGAIHGTGRMEMPTQGIYEGQWKDGQQNGFGIMSYINGEIYEGYFKDSLPHGHGIKKEGHFMASSASVYIGEWSLGMKQGYGVMDDIKTGEKYMGSWNNNMKHGSGLIITLDGIYYEGTFVQDIFMGHGIMVFEDGTHYEGEFKSVGVFGGKGILTFCNEEKLEGNFSGAWNEGIKVTATLHINNKVNEKSKHEPPSFGKLCARPDQKWKAIFRQFYQQLGLTDNSNNNNHNNNPAVQQLETQKLWQNVAAIISKSQRSYQKRQHFNNNTFLVSSFNQQNKEMVKNFDQLNKILCFGYEELNQSAYEQVHKYLSRAFESPHHPLGTLLSELATVYTATYGGVRVHPLLLEHAVSELKSITTRIYEAVTLFFPALPKADDQYLLRSENGDHNEEKMISSAAILHPILLPRVYSALFVLYALHNKKTDDSYWKRLMKWNKQPNNTLLAFLGVHQKFWKDFNTSENDVFLIDAIETLQQLKTTFSAVEKLIVIRNTYEQIELAIQKRLKENYKLSADDLIPIFYFVVVRASVLQLKSELHFIDDFKESHLMNGPIGYAFTTVMSIYDHILQEKISEDD
ncbi:alsin [Copidosoma floridanum]|uniref:alsin n=1 Tax=Copidosoma floridanum TaxID=29053 RepID=UPI0006C94346|nr:alsin [Copidosoma floridanum]